MKKIKVGKLYIGGENKVVVKALSTINTFDNTFKGRIVNPGKGDLIIGLVSNGFEVSLFEPFEDKTTLVKPRLSKVYFDNYIEEVIVQVRVFEKTNSKSPNHLLMNKTDFKKLVYSNLIKLKGVGYKFTKEDLKIVPKLLLGMQVFTTRDLNPGEFKVF